MKKKKPEHSHVGASSMERWSACPGSVALCAKIPSQSSAFAEEGTKAHELAAYLLTHELPPDNMAEFDEETLDAVYVYVNYVLDLWKGLERNDKSKIMVEHKFEVPELHPDFRGTADCAIYDGHNKKLWVIDYKHGMGIPVDPEGNLQLQYYGIGALMSLKLAVEEVELVIVQPRYSLEDAIKTWEVDTVDLLGFSADVVDAIKRTEEENAPTVTGDHCRFCSGKPICPTLRREADTAMKSEFALANLSTLTPDVVGELMQKLETIDAWVKGVREFAYQESKAGRIPTGFKLVPKRGIRRWADSAKAMTRFEQEINRNLVRELLTEPELKSPAQVEKVLGKSQKALVDSLTVSISSGDTLVPDSDKRQSVTTQQKAELLFGKN
jgi:hypothetical protein